MVSNLCQNEVETIRLRTTDYEMIIAQHGNFTVTLIQIPGKDKFEEKKEGEEKKE